jgi:hypothetical protein
VADVKDKGDAQKLSQVDVPLTMAPAANIRDTTVASIGEIGNVPSSDSICGKVPRVVCSPPTDMLSLMAIVFPVSKVLVDTLDWRLQR